LISGGLGLLVLAWLVVRAAIPSVSTPTDDREEIVFWGGQWLGEDVYTVLHRFEQQNPRYRVVLSSSVERDTSADTQRLMSAIAGGVPPDVVFFARFATGEWAGRGALTDLGPLLARQDPADPHRIDLADYHDFAVAEARYAPPGSHEPPKVYGIPTLSDLRVLYINADLFRQAGLADANGEPLVPRDWDELRTFAKRLTLHRTPGDPKSGITRLGFAPNFGNSWLYLYAWQAGGQFLSPDGTRATLDSPPVVRALQFMSDLYDDLGGIGQVNAFQEGAKSSEVDPFVRALVAMKIDNDYSLKPIAYWKPGMDFRIVPAPMPPDAVAQGRPPVTWSGGFSLVIPSTSQHKDGAFKLIQHLMSWESQSLLEQGKREQAESEGRLYLPEAVSNRVHFDRLVGSSIFDNPSVPPNFKRAYTVLRDLMPHTLHRPVTPVGQLLWNQHVRAYEAAVNHVYADDARRRGVSEPYLALHEMQRDVQTRLDELTAPPPPHRVGWTPYFAAYAGATGLAGVAMYITYHRRRREYGWRSGEVFSALVFVSPWLLGFLVLVGGPILFSAVLSFTRYDVLSPARYVGFDNFSRILHDPVFYRSLLNTGFMVLRIPLMMALSLSIAMLLNRRARGIGVYRTAYYVPAIVPLVAASLLWISIFNPGTGALNAVLGWFVQTPPAHWIEHLVTRARGSPFTFSLPLWLQDPTWSKPSLILMNLWTAGAGMVVWLAGLQAIPRQLYEAASIDGAGPWRRFRHVTLPMLSPYVLFNLIIGLIATLQIFGEAYIMTAGGPADSTLFYAYYLFRQAFQYFNMGYAAALAWILFLIVLALTVSQLWLSRRWVHYEHG
jgi:multiple sugar transport system permease protein